jgi:hypothetical protein
MYVSAMILHFLITVILIQRTNVTEEFWCSIATNLFRSQVILCSVSKHIHHIDCCILVTGNNRNSLLTILDSGSTRIKMLSDSLSVHGSTS